MGLKKRLKGLLGDDLVDDLHGQVKDVLERGLDRHVRIAVTGMSRSGKTVFITALTQHLLASDKGESLPFFALSSSDQIISVKLLPVDKDHAFPLQTAVHNLAAEPPTWPASTTGLSEVRLAIRYRPASRLQRLVSDIATLYVDIIDYPGEWLLDLPLLHKSFEQWCSEQRELFDLAPRAALATDWLAAQAAIDWSQPVDQAQLSILNREYVKLLHLFRSEQYGMSVIQPGRAVLPAELENDTLIELFPLIAAKPAETLEDNSGYRVMEQRYLDYREQVIKRFYREHFARFDRQVVLVDCLKTLNKGQQCFDDMRLAVTDVLQSFNYGPSGFLRRLLSPRIDKVLFASTKADHVTANQHHNLDRFLELIIADARREMQFEGIETTCMALASVRSTEAAEAVLDGQTISCLKGYKKASGEPVALFPGEVPIELPTEKDWHSQRFRFVDFAPRKLPMQQLRPEHHIRLDQAIEYLLGDLF